MTTVLRVLIADLPDLQADVLAGLVGAEPDMLVVGRGLGPGGLARSIEELAPDVVVMAHPIGGCDPAVLLALADGPQVGVVALDEASGTIARVALVPDDDSWPARVVATIRSAAPRDPARYRLAAED